MDMDHHLGDDSYSDRSTDAYYGLWNGAVSVDLRRGAVLSLIGRIMTPYRGHNMRVKRLHRIEIWSSVFFCAATFFMFYQTAGARDWLAFTLAGGAVLVYTSIMIPRAEKNRSN